LPLRCEAEWGDMRVGSETYLADFDDTELLKRLPDDAVNVLIGVTCWRDA
jgi:hypothetical protein